VKLQAGNAGARGKPWQDTICVTVGVCNEYGPVYVFLRRPHMLCSQQVRELQMEIWRKGIPLHQSMLRNIRREEKE